MVHGAPRGRAGNQGRGLNFTGEFRHTIDAKGRLIVPSRIRDELAGERVWLTRWLDDCIALWSDEGWNEIRERLMAQPGNKQAARRFVRTLTASAHPDGIDRQGRIQIPQKLRDIAGIAREAVVIGALNRAEIWSPQRWEEQQSAVEEDRFEDLAEGLEF